MNQLDYISLPSYRIENVRFIELILLTNTKIEPKKKTLQTGFIFGINFFPRYLPILFMKMKGGGNTFDSTAMTTIVNFISH